MRKYHFPCFVHLATTTTVHCTDHNTAHCTVRYIVHWTVHCYVHCTVHFIVAWDTLVPWENLFKYHYTVADHFTLQWTVQCTLFCVQYCKPYSAYSCTLNTVKFIILQPDFKNSWPILWVKKPPWFLNNVLLNIVFTVL